eukprot:4456474-Amphidinium_carterae.1
MRSAISMAYPRRQGLDHAHFGTRVWGEGAEVHSAHGTKHTSQPQHVFCDDVPHVFVADAL